MTQDRHAAPLQPDSAASITVGQRENQRRLAVRHRKGAGTGLGRPGLVWLGGYRSDMSGTKAEALDAWCAGQGLAFTRFDYSGHGQSGGSFRDGTISRWVEEALAVLDAFAAGPQILVGSSMGGWIALRLVQELRKRGQSNRIAALMLIAPAPDFTSELLFNRFTPTQMDTLMREGWVETPSQYSDEPNIYTRELYEDGRANAVLGGMIETGCPVHILQGMQDPDVPHTHAMRLVEHLPSEQVTVTLVKDGDHRLSRPQDIELLLRIVGDLVVSFTGKSAGKSG